MAKFRGRGRPGPKPTLRYVTHPGAAVTLPTNLIPTLKKWTTLTAPVESTRANSIKIGLPACQYS